MLVDAGQSLFNFGLDSSHQSKQDTIMGISKILVVGATGYLGPFITAASVRLGHPTFALVRPATARPDSSKKELIESFKASGITILEVHTFNPQLFLSSILFYLL